MCKSREEVVASLVKINNVNIECIKFKDGKIHAVVRNPKNILNIKSVINDAYRVIDGEGLSMNEIKVRDASTGKEVDD